MKHMFLARTIFAMVLLLILSSCAQSGLQIGYSVNLCCPGNYSQYRTYSLESQEMPGFLQEYVASEFNVAIQERGLVRNDNNADVAIKLIYRHINLNPEQETIDPFERRTEMDVTLRYVATILVEIYETNSGAQVWSGQINRIHNVYPGEYMHEDRAKPAFLATFRELLANYPTI